MRLRGVFTVFQIHDLINPSYILPHHLCGLFPIGEFSVPQVTIGIAQAVGGAPA